VIVELLPGQTAVGLALVISVGPLLTVIVIAALLVQDPEEPTTV
jgi:hypothetical protein